MSVYVYVYARPRAGDHEQKRNKMAGGELASYKKDMQPAMQHAIEASISTKGLP